MYVWSGSAWTEISSSAEIIAYKYTATAGATSVSGADDNSLTLSYTVGKEQVYINGVLQVRGTDYVATTGSSITGMAALTASDIVTVLAFTAFSVSNTYTQAEANALFIPNAIVDAKGDLIVATAADTVARLAAGNNGESLVADSTTASGLRYQATQAAGKNLVINGGFDIWQRGTSFTTSGVFCADRYVTSIDSPSAGTIAQQTTSLPAGFRYSIRCQRNSGNTGTGGIGVAQALESSMSIPAQGKTVTLSYWAKAGANYSNAGSAVSVRINSGTGIDQAGGNTQFGGWTGYAETAPDQAITTTWTRYTATYTVPSTATQLGIRFFMSGVGTAGANDWFEITGVQLEIGSVATAFSRNASTIQGELAACQRYYVRFGNDQNYTYLGTGNADSTTKANVPIPLPVSMRVAPTSIDYSSLMLQNNGGSSIFSVTALTFSPASINGKNMGVAYPTVASGLTQGTPYVLAANGTTNGYLAFGAEL
jgi:hypothetical protein